MLGITQYNNNNSSKITYNSDLRDETEFPLPLLFAIIGGVGVAAVVIPIVYLKKRKH